MTETEARKLLSEKLVFGDPQQIAAKKFLGKLEDAREAMKECEECDGTGRTELEAAECGNCDEGHVDCPDCAGKEEGGCKKCEGRGTVDCWECDGDGVIEEFQPCVCLVDFSDDVAQAAAGIAA